MEISMPTVMIKFALPEEDAEMKLALRASEYQQALYRVTQEIFRPARKHGYDNAKLQALMNDNPASYEIIGMLEDLFFEIIKEEGVDLE
jgi:hypothetical protein